MPNDSPAADEAMRLDILAARYAWLGAYVPTDVTVMNGDDWLSRRRSK